MSVVEATEVPVEHALRDITEEDIERALEEMFAEPVERIEKGIGYCNNSECQDYYQGIFLMLHTGPYTCRRCAQVGFAIAESGKAEVAPGKFFKEVRVRFNYSPARRDYLQTAIVRDDALGSGCGTYYLDSPMCKTEKRAFSTGERLLSVLNERRYDSIELTIPPLTRENILNLDRPVEEIRRWLEEFEVRIKGNPFFKKEPEEGTGVVSQLSVDF